MARVSRQSSWSLWPVILLLGILSGAETVIAQMPLRAGCKVEDFGLRPKDVQENPERNPCWDWQKDVNYTLFPTQDRVEIPLPFNSPSHACKEFTNPPDVDPDDGWVLLYRAFGTEERSVPLPMFALYNRKTGAAQLFFVAGEELANNFSFGLIDVSLSSAKSDMKARPALLTATTDPVGTLTSFDAEVVQVSSLTLSSRGWSCAMFDFSGFDPGTSKREDAALRFKLWGVNESTLEAKGIFRPSDRKMKVLSSSDDVEAQLKAGYDVYSSVDEAIASASKWAREKRQLPVAAGGKPPACSGVDPICVLAEIADGPVGPVISTLAGIVSFFTWQGKEDGITAVRIADPLHLSGTLVSRREVGNGWTLRLPGAESSKLSVAPAYELPMGVFNLVRTPRVAVFRDWEREIVTETNPATGKTRQCERFHAKHDLLQLRNPIEYVVNPEAGVRVESIEVALVEEGKAVPSDGWTYLDLFQEATLKRPASGTLDHCSSFQLQKNPFVGLRKDQLALRAVLRSTTGNAEERIHLSRRYAVEFEPYFKTPARQLLLPENRALAHRQLGPPLVARSLVVRSSHTLSSEPSLQRVQGSLAVRPKGSLGMATDARVELRVSKKIVLKGDVRLGAGRRLVLGLADPAARDARFRGNQVPES